MSEEHVTKRIFTTCSEAYDYNQATTINPFVGRDGRGRVIREVEITESPYRVDYQILRYRSSFTDLVADPMEFFKLVDAGLLKLKEQLVERDPDPALAGD
jgi:hypothetical protein